MRILPFALILITLTTYFALRTPSDHHSPHLVIVRRTIDGDTFVSSSNAHIRIWGIDAPEMPSRAGREARWALAGIIAQSHNQLLCDSHGLDHYNRPVMRCTDREKRDVARLMLEQGQACEWLHYSHGFYGARNVCREHAGFQLN